jgi:tRNA(Ile)-lysidine synthase
VDGLAAMPVYGLRASASVMRPFLGFPRSTLESYARSKKLHWIEDESNQDCRFDRNFLRHEVFPILKRRFSAYRATLSRAVENLNDASLLLTQLAEADAGLALSDGKLDIAWMKTQTQERSMNLLRWWIRNETGMNLSRARLLNILDQLLNAQANAQIYCQLGGMVLRRYRNWACVDRRQNSLPYRIYWHGEDVLSLPDGGRLHFKQVVGQGISANEIKDGLVITNRLGAESSWKLSLRPDCNRPTRSLKNLWQEVGIPPWERDRQPLCWNNGVLVAVLGLGVDCGKLSGKNEAGVLVALSESPDT